MTADNVSSPNPAGAESVLDEKDPVKALDAFRSLSTDEKLATVFADGSMLRYEVKLVEDVVSEIRRWGRRTVSGLAIAAVVLIVLAFGNRSIGSQIKDCTTPNTACTDRLRQDGTSGTLCAVVLLQNDNRVVNGFDPDHDGTVDTIPVPQSCKKP
jgi:hypothetical protein